jgi:hypothetical protein
MEKPKTLCLAPWVHTYLSPQTERRMCCASREPAQNFEQYIDTKFLVQASIFLLHLMSIGTANVHMKSVRYAV